MPSDLPQHIVQGWVDAVSEGAAAAVLECIHGDRPMGYASLSDASGTERLALVLVICGEPLCTDVLEALQSQTGAVISSPACLDS